MRDLYGLYLQGSFKGAIGVLYQGLGCWGLQLESYMLLGLGQAGGIWRFDSIQGSA